MQLSNIISLIAALAPFFMHAAEQTTDNNIRTVIINTPQGRYERSLYNCPWDTVNLAEKDIPVPSAPLASDEEFKYVANIQKHTPGAPKAPVVLFETGSKSPRDNGPGYKGIMHFDANNCIELYTTAMPLQLCKEAEKQFFIGHEIKHLAYRTDIAKNQSISKQQELVVHRRKQEITAVCAGITSIGILASMKGSKVKNKLFVMDLIYKTAIAIMISWYAFNRFKGYYDSKPLHEEELACDQFAVNTGKTPQEKIAIARAGKAHIKNDPWCNLLLTSTHPSKYTRFNQFDSMIAEQQNILNSINVEISPNGFGASITL